MSPAGARSRATALVLFVVALVVGIAGGRRFATGGAEVRLADAAAQRSDWPLSIAHARAAAEALAPGSPWPERGWSRLEALGHDAEARGDDPTAFLAYGAMRAAALATRGPLSGAGLDARRARAEEGLARVAASEREPASRRAASASMLDALREEEPPAVWWLCALAASALAMTAGLGRLAWLGPEAASARVTKAVAVGGLLAYAAVTLTR